MTEKSLSEQCTDDTRQFIINIPCRLALRVERYAQETGNTTTGVVIEALDTLLMRGRKLD